MTVKFPNSSNQYINTLYCYNILLHFSEMVPYLYPHPYIIPPSLYERIEYTYTGHTCHFSKNAKYTSFVSCFNIRRMLKSVSSRFRIGRPEQPLRFRLGK